MSTSTPSTRVTGHPDTGPNNTLCNIADQKICNSQISGLHMRRWFSGRTLASHAGTRVRFPDGADYIFHPYTP